MEMLPPLDGKGLIDVRSVDSISLDASDTKCPGQDEICCRFPNYRCKKLI